MELLDREPERNLFDEITPGWAYGGSSGARVKVAVIDSGIDSTHPELKDCLKGDVEVALNETGNIVYREGPHTDAFGHGTACAGIIRSIAPDVEIYSVKVLGSTLTGTGNVMLSGVKWAVDNRMDILNLSLGTTKDAFYATFNKITEEAYFRNCLLVAALSNTNPVSYPAVFSSIIGVKAVEEANPFHFYLNPEPPVEIFARGILVRIPWLQHGYFTTSGNSFAAPVITGITALIKSKHPTLNPVQMKVVIHALAKKWGDYGHVEPRCVSAGEMAFRSHIPEETLKGYVQENLLTPAGTDESGAPLFPEQDIVKAVRIRVLKEQQFTPEEIAKKVRAG